MLEHVIPRRYWPKAWQGCFYWADVHKVEAFNRDIRDKRTEVMMLLPLGRYGLCVIRQRDRERRGR
jgi:hypothetical protein